jgi:hypothetical protein
MGKIINVTMVILLCIGIIFGIWKDDVYQKYIDKGISPPQSTFCLYARVESFLAGIVSIWAGVNLIFKPASLAKLLGKADYSPVHIFSTMCFGLFWLLIGIFSLWHVFIPNSPYCGVP